MYLCKVLHFFRLFCLLHIHAHQSVCVCVYLCVFANDMHFLDFFLHGESLNGSLIYFFFPLLFFFLLFQIIFPSPNHYHFAEVLHRFNWNAIEPRAISPLKQPKCESKKKFQWFWSDQNDVLTFHGFVWETICSFVLKIETLDKLFHFSFFLCYLFCLNIH